MVGNIGNGASLFQRLRNQFSNHHVNPGKEKAPNPVSVEARESNPTDADSVSLSERPVKDLPEKASAGDSFQKMLNDSLLASVGLSPEQGMSAQYMKTQFQVNISAVRAVGGASGMKMESFNFSMNASFEYLGVMAGGEPGQMPFAIPGMNGADGAEPVDAASAMDQMMEFFSPEKTAERILDFALSFFPSSSMFEEGGDTEASRQEFSDFIGEAIQKGFDEAMGILGEVPDETQEHVDKTHENVFAGLDDFVKNGMPEEKAGEGGLWQQIQAYSMEISMSYQSVSVSSYDNHGRGVPVAPPHNGDVPAGGLNLEA